jgi:hypothetical protein
MTSPSNEPPMDERALDPSGIIPEFRNGRIDYHGLRVPEAIYRFMKELEDKKKGENHE